ncbi:MULTISPECIES: hypothetical protein [unclassified Flavobacterium]|uniref:hypothetical protein n=1 Tax=unclassified Flavobacterium TaxID=196869 RepID=UPI000EAC3019|nr:MULTISPECIES: hypothetical protein [unclassified Flavobacterium]
MDSLFLKILLQNLKELNFVPACNSEELSILLKKTEVVFFDGTEHCIQRSLHKEEQKRDYSGKKEHTINRPVLKTGKFLIKEFLKALPWGNLLSKTYNGTTHDKKWQMADDESLIFPERCVLKLFQDTGYQGYNLDNTTVFQKNLTIFKM